MREGRGARALAALALLAMVALMGAVNAKAADYPGPATATTAPDAPAPGVRPCLRCHEGPAMTDLLASPHGRGGDPQTRFASDGCETCHGASLAHQRRPAPGEARAAPDVVFSGPHAAAPETGNAVCLGCHEGGLRHDWRGSPHEAAGLPCATCHKSHVARDPVLAAPGQAPVCFSCHKEQRAKSLRPSHHPIAEGTMVCADCHNPHGAAAPHLLKGLRLTDTCLGCHAEKRGPFLWEHPPVTEDCATCHDPHGSTQANLLVQRVPYLCQTCHDSGAHVSLPLSGANLAGGSNPSASMTLRGCVNCHTEVHGSNHPSGVRRMR